MDWSKTAIATTITLFIAFSSVPSFGAEKKLETSQWKNLLAATDEELKEIIERAKVGDTEAQHNLGLMYDGGLGVKQDYAESVKWYRKAAEQGIASAQFDLGWMYVAGKGVTQDYAEAVKWYRKAAEQGYVDAQHNLGVMYYEGKGIKQNYTEMVKWYRKAAEQGHAYAQHNLGVMYYEGKGMPKSDDVAIGWLYKAGLSYLKKGEREDALSMLESIEKIVPGHLLAKKLMKKIYGDESKPNKDK